MAEAELAQPCHEALDLSLADGDLGQCPAEDDGDAVRGVALELGAQVAGDERRAPAELDDVDAPAGDLQHAIDLGDRQPLVDHVGDARLARLARPRGDVEEVAYGDAEGLSAPTTTATLADGASAATPVSIGW